MNSRERVLKLFNGELVDRPACFSGMGNVANAGLEQLGYKFAHCHNDANMMANLAATSYKLFGYECAVVPFDMCVEAEVMGAKMNAYEDVEQLLYPTIKEKAILSEEDMKNVAVPQDVSAKGRVPVVTGAIRLLKDDIGSEVAIGAWVLGPFTLAGQLIDLDMILKLSAKKVDLVNEMLDKLADVQIAILKAYIEAGADYVTVREMGATTDVISPRTFKRVIAPHLSKISAAITEVPTVLHICGAVDNIMAAMNECGYTALSIEKKTDLKKARETIGNEPLLFGNVDPFGTITNGTPEDITQAVIEALEGGCDAIWPGCDLWPDTPLENLKTYVEAVAKYGEEKWVRKR